MMDNEDSSDMPDWVRDPPMNPSIGAIKKETENSRLLKRQSILRGNNGKRESLGSINISPQQQIIVNNEYEDDDIECFGSFFDPVLLWFRTFHTLSLLCGLACACANLYVLSKLSTSIIIPSVRDISIRIYTVICSLLIVITEGDWRYIMHRVRILDLWFFRGFYYAFVGFLTLSDAPIFKDGIQPQDICGYIEIGMGCVYVIFGVMCVKSIKLQHLAKYDKKNNNIEKNIINPMSDIDFVSV